MNKFYFIIPVVLLAAFVAYYSQFSKEFARREADKAQHLADLKAEDDRKKQEAIAKAAEEAHQREEAQRAAEAAAEAERRAKWDADNQKIADETADYQQKADVYARQAADLDAQLDSLRNTHDQASRDLFDLQKQIELAKIDRRNAELEIQRTYDMVTEKVAASTLANFTPAKAK
jgi:membrane protein involved in colicin uptake